MSRTKILLFTSLFFIAVILLSVSSTPAQASLFNNLNNLFSQGKDTNIKNKDFTLEANVALAPDGDENKNNEIDSGDIVRFTYTLINTTDKNYTYATLQTNVDRKQLNFIHALRGVTGLSDVDGTITFHNVRINSQEQRVISFDARINYYREDTLIFTEPEFFSSDNQSIGKSQKNEVLAKKLSNEEIKKRLENRGVVVKGNRNQ